MTSKKSKNQKFLVQKRNLEKRYEHKTSKVYPKNARLEKKNKVDMEIECLAGATDGCSLKTICPKF